MLKLLSVASAFVISSAARDLQFRVQKVVQLRVAGSVFRRKSEALLIRRSKLRLYTRVGADHPNV